MVDSTALQWSHSQSKKRNKRAVSSEKCCKFARQLRAIVKGKRADFSKKNSSSPKGGAYTRFINYSR